MAAVVAKGRISREIPGEEVWFISVYGLDFRNLYLFRSRQKGPGLL